MYELCLRQLPIGLQIRTNVLVVLGVVAWRAQRDRGDEAAAERLVQRRP